MLKYISKYFSKRLLINKIGLFEFIRLKSCKKFHYTHTIFNGKKLQLVDASTFLTLVNEIFIEEIYKFNSNTSKPIIFDCGANIGLATIYFKQIYPNSIIYSYEPDPSIFETLKFNIASCKFDDVILINKAISNSEGYCEFVSDGSLSGMISTDSNANVISVKTERLRYILKDFSKIDFLKIDIEGHEDIVIDDIKDELNKVQFLFLEYHSCVNKPQSLGHILQILSDTGFRYYFKESDFKEYPFIDKVLFHDFDTVVNIFCYK
jgi:FkbM family methyltransferase